MNYPNPHLPGCPWYNITESQGAPNIKWCEETLCHWISEPANTWSNIGYFVVAMVILHHSFKNKDHFELKLFGPIVLFTGAMSFFYHQSNFYTSQILDFIGMFFLVGWVKGMNLIRLGKLRRENLILFNLIVSLTYCVIMHEMYIRGIMFQSLVLISAFIIIVTEFVANRRQKVGRKWFVAAIVTLVVAFGFSISDGQRLWCEPTNHGWFSQGHALWHWIASIAMFMLYKHYSQDKLKPQA